MVINSLRRPSACTAAASYSAASRSRSAGAAKATLSTLRKCGEFLYHREVGTHDRDEHHLRKTLARLQPDYLGAAVPCADQDGAGVVRIYQPHQVAQNQPFLMP